VILGALDVDGLEKILVKIFDNSDLRGLLKEKGVKSACLVSMNYENLGLEPDNLESWMGIGKQFYGNVKTYEFSSHPVFKDNKRLYFRDGKGANRLAEYILNRKPELTRQEITNNLLNAAKLS